MDRTYVLAKEAFGDFFSSLRKLGRVYAPVKVSEQSYSFRQVENPQEIAFEALRTILPPKKFFYPQEEAIFHWQDGEFKEKVPDSGFQVLFGIHPCDLAGLGIMDTIYTSEPADSHYLKRRQASLIVGLSCLPDKHCFCESMGTDCPSSGYDIFLTDTGSSYFVETRTPSGFALMKAFQAQVQSAHAAPGASGGNSCQCASESGKDAGIRPAAENDRQAYKEFWNKRSQSFANKFAPDNLQAIMEMEWGSNVWKELGERCLSCGNCTPVCPTCYCFDLVDIAALNGDEGERKRQWDSCQFVGFAQVGSDFNFRATPVDRLKFWYRHKLHGFDDPYGFKTCVGCGRCTVSCPAGIDDIVQVVKILQGKKQGYDVTHLSQAGESSRQNEGSGSGAASPAQANGQAEKTGGNENS